MKKSRMVEFGAPVACDVCGKACNRLHETEQGHVCDTCRAKAGEVNTMACTECGKDFTFDKLAYAVVGRKGPVCAKCAAKANVCADCGAPVSELNSVRLGNGRLVCDMCREKYVHCVHCGVTLLADKAIANPSGGGHFCSRCYTQTHKPCPACGAHMLRSSGRMHKVDQIARFAAVEPEAVELYAARNGFTSLSVCPDCSGRIKHGASYARTLCAYNYRPTSYSFLRASKADISPLLGLELELESGDDGRPGGSCGACSVCEEGSCGSYDRDQDEALSALFRVVSGLPGQNVVKTDGSLSAAGYEVVLSPRSVDYLRTYRSELASIMSVAHEYGYAEFAGNAGMHIHVDRSVFGSVRHLRRLLYTVYRVLGHSLRPSAWKALTGGRDWGALCRWASVGGVSVDHIRGVDDNYLSPNRYTAINCTEHTIEFRIFNAALCTEDILRAVDTVDMFLQFSLASCGTPDRAEFVDFVASGGFSIKARELKFSE